MIKLPLIRPTPADWEIGFRMGCEGKPQTPVLDEVADRLSYFSGFIEGGVQRRQREKPD